MKLAEIPYPDDSFELFSRYSDLPWPVFLDSAGCGRYDIIAAAPEVKFTTRGPLTEIEEGGEKRISERDPFTLLREALGERAEKESPLPFCGGAIGAFGYDLGRGRAGAAPDMMVGIYDWAIVVDHREKKAFLASHGRRRETEEKWSRLRARAAAASPALSGWECGQIEADCTREEYGEKFARVRNYLRAGDCYQVNLALSFSAAFSGSPLSLYRDLRKKNPAPFSAYFSAQGFSLLSASPERFLKVEAGKVETRPIKGTRPRSNDREKDARLAVELQASEKDRAENLMIVDLLRNDLGKACATGSVKVPSLFALESFASVHHLVSTVEGRLAPGQDALSLIAACFPGGSITGAPKKRAMEIIEECESSQRGFYCGSIGYIGFDGDMDSNIAIRTLVASAGKIEFRAGGGIVLDSDCEAEYREIHHKACAFFSLLGNKV